MRTVKDKSELAINEYIIATDEDDDGKVRGYVAMSVEEWLATEVTDWLKASPFCHLEYQDKDGCTRITLDDAKHLTLTDEQIKNLHFKINGAQLEFSYDINPL